MTSKGRIGAVRVLILCLGLIGSAATYAGAQVPAPWVNSDIGNPSTAGSASLAGGTFSVRGAGTDIWSASDQFHFMYQPVNGDLEIVARVASIQQRDAWSKAGVMIREALTPTSAHAFMTGTAASGWAFQRRPATGAASLHSPGSFANPPGWVRLVRSGDIFRGYESTDGTNWVLVASETIPMASTVYVGLAVTSHQSSSTSTATFTNVTVTPTEPPNQPPTVTLTVPANGTSYTAPATITMTATASDNDGTVSKVDFYAGAQLIHTDTTSSYGATWSNVPTGTYDLKAVATDNDGATTSSAIARVTVNAPSNQPPTASITSPSNGATFPAPATITINANASDSNGTITKVEFYRGSTLVGSDTSAPYSYTWSGAAAGSYALTAVAFDNGGASTTSAAVNVTVNAPSGGVPAPWTSGDLGGPALAGSSSVASGTFTVTGAGTDIWGTADQFQFVHQPLQGDVEVIARVATIQGPITWSKGGVMIRETLTAGSPNVYAAMTVGEGWTFQRRIVSGGVSTGLPSRPAGTAPGWLRLVRTGNQFTGYYSLDGNTWTQYGTETIAMASTVYVGLAVTAHDPTGRATATFTNITARPLTTNTPPTVAITSPSNGATFPAPATITINANASDSNGTITRVEFYRGSTLVGSDTSAPYSYTWSGAAAGSYALTAVAFDNAGASTTSAAVNVTVNAPSNQPPTASITSPSNGATFPAPATITINANASDSNGTITKVEFYRGSTLVGSDTSAPYSYTWSGAAAGSYALTAVAFDNGGASTTSAAVNVTVSTIGWVPAPWLSGDVGAPALAGSSSFANGTFTVTGAGTDIWGTADQFQFVHQPLQGDVEVIARVATIQGPITWSKGGVMIRETLTAGSPNVYAAMTVGEGWTFQRRIVSGGVSTGLPSRPAGTAPGWLRLVRTGNQFTGYYSLDGNTWTQYGTETIAMASTVYVGLAVTAHDPTGRATATFTNITARPLTTNTPPTVAITSPSNGATFPAPATITINANASDSNGTITRVEFYRGSTLVGSDTSAPYSYTWSGAAAGSYALTAVAFDNAGASTTSAAVNVTVNAPSNQPPTASITSPSNGATFPAPATITINATASDSNGTITKVEFYRGSTLVGSDTSAPYSYTWSGAAAGSYALTAVAFDNGGASTTSTAVNVTVTGSQPPTSVAFTASPDHATGVTSYSVAIRRAGDPVSATPVATKNLGKPTPVSNEITADISDIVNPLAAGSYYAVVTAIGPAGSTSSSPSPTFNK